MVIRYIQKLLIHFNVLIRNFNGYQWYFNAFQIILIVIEVFHFIDIVCEYFLKVFQKILMNLNGIIMNTTNISNVPNNQKLTMTLLQFIVFSIYFNFYNLKETFPSPPSFCPRYCKPKAQVNI